MGSIDWSSIWQFFTYDPSQPLLFNSARFFIFFLVAYGFFLLLRKRTFARTAYLFLFSVYFYYLSSGVYFWLLLLSTVVNFGLGHLLEIREEPWRRKLWMTVSVLFNLGILAYFKYTNFFIDTANQLTGNAWDFQRIFLPVGISFYTFQVLSYTIDIYRRKIQSLSAGLESWQAGGRALIDFAFFVSFFPQLVAGPIVRAADFLPQIRQPLSLSREQMGQAFLLIIGGLFKKAVISDYISVNFVDRVFDNPGLYSGLENLLASYGYAIQIYCDFSGYSDMAIGLALLMGFQLPENFRTPYQSDSIQGFWRRWHISLSSWLRDYLYISLGGNRKGSFRTYINLMITMLLGGLWHGASWVFVIWGGLHGMALAIDRFLSNKKGWWQKTIVRIGGVWLLVLFIIQAVLYWRWSGDQIDVYTYQQMSGANRNLFFIWLGSMLLALLGDYFLRALSGKDGQRWSRSISVLLVFHFVCLCWIFFRSGAAANTLSPTEITYAMLGQIGSGLNWELAGEIVRGYSAVVGLIALGFLLHFLPRKWDLGVERLFVRMPSVAQAFVLFLVIWIVIQTASAEVVPFIYFQF
ncbi:MBOAT family O-acyltransferase [Flavilitoribacter nigricans]|uniref:Membrane-bound O-acyltransferase family protein n=1 Tax=Flavilitoribacter nigricans (strain ATCC 23147 / DSM 23189 / NBRC 102662 / NCIMB 1420 / SS-2) TaxID=1122177 RepID=A0A2D0NG97_FLAN2|nr:MBOAT family O-acyltransferase [Flavilitoribacter nigricans]PHN07521.1 membrane-bound O-acyltransferase family protein [Flavilitoribacter nigricans DSM 23189 = NBRC 102662]